MKALLFAAAALLLPQAEDASALFKKFEKSLRESKAFEVSFESTFQDQGKDAGQLSGKIRLAKENKAVVEASGTVDGKPFSLRVISDGNNLKLTTSARENVGIMPTPQNLNEDLVQRFARSSAKQAVQDLLKILLKLEDEKGGVRSPEPSLAMVPPTPGHFKMGDPETLQGVTRLQIQFVIADSGSGDRSQVALWLEKDSLAPAKRKLEPLQDRGTKVTETYTNAGFDAKFPRDAFKITNK